MYAFMDLAKMFDTSSFSETMWDFQLHNNNFSGALYFLLVLETLIKLEGYSYIFVSLSS